ncbi:MAG: alpha-amylase family glycosyl hydrolase, partial [bacterium]
MNLKYCLTILILFVTTSVLARDPIPEWAKGAVWYQILPERFRNTNPYNDPTKERVVGKKVQDWQIHPWASDWYKLQIWEANRGLDFYDLVSDRRYGGDLLGVIEKLRYLKGLGVDVIYLSPVFESPSILKYDVSTFHHIDNNFGSDRDGDWDKIISEKEDAETWTLTSADKVFLDLIAKAHELDMKIVIEAQCNFCGREFWAFKDLEENQQNSAYKDWFEVLNWDDPATPDTIEFEYKSWHNNKSRPVFKKDKTNLVEPVKKYLFDVTRRWMDPNGDRDPLDGIDGWFINSAEEMSSEFWQEWHTLVKSINPQVLTVAEFLSEAPAWMDENNFDVVTNYALASLMQNFFIDQNLKSGISEFNEKLAKLRTAYPEERNLCLLNLIDSHRTNRLASMFTNSDESHNHDTISSNHHNY